MHNDDLAAVVKELTIIRKLLIFALMDAGASQQKIADVLGVNQSQVSRMLATTKGNQRTR